MSRRLVRLLAFLTVCLFLLSGLLACREEWSGTYPYDLEEYVSLCSYRNIPVLGWEVEVTDEEIERQVLLTRSQYSTLTQVKGRGAEELDFLVIDYEGRVDGEVVDFLSEKKCELVLGSGVFIDGFEEALYGTYEGDSVTLTLTLPTPYKEMPSYSGKSVTFHISVKEVDEQNFRPYTDEMIAGATEYESIAAFEKAIRETLLAEKRETLNRYLEEQVWAYVKENSRILAIPEAEIEAKYTEAMDFYHAVAIRNEKTFDEYAEELGYESGAAFEASIRAEVESAVADEMLFYAIARREKLMFSEAEYTEGATAYAASMGVASLEALELIYGREEIESTLLFDKVKQYLADEAKISDYESGKRIRYNVIEDKTVSPLLWVYIGIFLTLGAILTVAILLGDKKKGKIKSTNSKKKRKKSGA